PEGTGLDQGARALIQEQLTAALVAPVAADKKNTRQSVPAVPRPLLGPSQTDNVRSYIAVGIARRERRGPLSTRVNVPLVPPPPPPAAVKVGYTETAITISWPPASTITRSEAGNALPSKPIGWSPPAIAYNVYEVSDPSKGSGSDHASSASTETRLTKSPAADSTFADERIAWGAERCYVVRTVETIGDLTIESDAPPPACTKLVDTFPPAAPRNLKSVPGQASIDLIWDPNNERDLAGYIVLRGTGEGSN